MTVGVLQGPDSFLFYLSNHCQRRQKPLLRLMDSHPVTQYAPKNDVSRSYHTQNYSNTSASRKQVRPWVLYIHGTIGCPFVSHTVDQHQCRLGTFELVLSLLRISFLIIITEDNKSRDKAHSHGHGREMGSAFFNNSGTLGHDVDPSDTRWMLILGGCCGPDVPGRSHNICLLSTIQTTKTAHSSSRHGVGKGKDDSADCKDKKGNLHMVCGGTGCAASEGGPLPDSLCK